MEPEFWNARWRENRIDFHQPRVDDALVRFVHRAERWPGERVLVPMAGKSVDMRWLRDRGHRVVAIEWVEAALEAFFQEQEIQASRTVTPYGAVFRTEGIEAHAGDFFALGPERLGRFDWIWDRASLVALPEEKRRAYAARIRPLLGPGGRVLLSTMVYRQSEMPGPPFSVDEDEIGRLYPEADRTRLLTTDLLARVPKLAERGLTAVREEVWLLSF